MNILWGEGGMVGFFQRQNRVGLLVSECSFERTQTGSDSFCNIDLYTAKTLYCVDDTIFFL